MSKRDIDEFRRWLRYNVVRKDPVGDFALDFLRDDCAANVRTLSGIDRHLRLVHDADDKVLAARDRAWREYAETRPAPGS